MRTTNILIVDDEFLVLLSLQHELELLGFSSFELAGTVAEAQTLLRSKTIDLAFLDVNLGSETSYDIADELDALGIPYAFVTGYGHQGIASSYRDKPIAPKPITAGGLKQALDQATYDTARLN